MLFAFLKIYLNANLDKFKTTIFLVILVLSFSITTKYHFRLNEQRKFHELINTDLNLSKEAYLIDKKLKGLKWITLRHKDPIREINLIKDTLQKIKNDKRKKMVITHYQFFSFLLEEDLNIPNRWYFLGNNTFPLINHKHFEIYNIQKRNLGILPE